MNLPPVSRRPQQGFALLVMVIVLILGSTFILVTQLTGSAQRLNRSAVSASILAQAREALIGFAALNANRPGALPCPDRNVPGSANEGTALGTCATSDLRIGRLPWKTLGLPDLRDASGERLWYALSNNFRDTGVVNSETQGTLTITGTAPANNVVAIVFAPGPALSGQNRDPSNSANLISVANYLDGANADTANDDTFQTALSSGTFNDEVLAITHADLFAVVENYVAKRIGTELKPFIQSFVVQWGAYPFAVPFTTPSATQNTYKGTAGTTYGLLPLTLDPAFLTWRIPAASEQLVTQTGHVGSATGTVTSDCSSSTSTVFTCSITYTKTGGSGNFQPNISVMPTLKNVGMALVDYAQVKVPGAGISISGSSTGVVEPAWSSNTLRTDGGADMLFSGGTLRATGGSGTRTVTLTITWSGSTSQYLYVTGQPSDWFFTNQWYRMTYYSISTGYGPGQSLSCVAVGSPLCLTVNNATAPTNNKGVLVILAGRANAGQTRPSGNLSDYLEGENLTPADRIFEWNIRSNTFNDRAVVLAP